MILQRLISEAAKIPDFSQEVILAQKKFNAISAKTELGPNDLEELAGVSLRQYSCETMQRRIVNLKSIETHIVKAKHSVVEEEEDFV